MWKVDIYLETDSTFQGKKHRRCGYVLATQLRTGEKTKGGFGYTEGTYHQAILKTLAEAFFRMNKSAEICVHTQDSYVNSRLLKLDEMAEAGWHNSKGELIKNAAEWKEVHEQFHQDFPQSHKLSTKCGKHCYSMWIEEQLKTNEECERPMGPRMESAPGSGSKDNGVPGNNNPSGR